MRKRAMQEDWRVREKTNKSHEIKAAKDVQKTAIKTTEKKSIHMHAIVHQMKIGDRGHDSVNAN